MKSELKQLNTKFQILHIAAEKVKLPNLTERSQYFIYDDNKVVFLLLTYISLLFENFMTKWNKS